jgi:photosystem II stability/assembly factor-like uncharacterized protein
VLAGSPQAGASSLAPRSLLASPDGGRTWTEYKMGSLPVDWRQPWLDHLQFLDASRAWLRTGAVLLFTEDGGKTWTQMH